MTTTTVNVEQRGDFNNILEYEDRYKHILGATFKDLNSCEEKLLISLIKSSLNLFEDLIAE